MGVFPATRELIVRTSDISPSSRSLRPGRGANPVTTTILSLLILAFPVLLALALPACTRGDGQKTVTLEGAPRSRPSSPTAPARARRLRVAVGAMVSPKETLATYSDLLSYIGKKLGMKVEFIQRKTYEEINALVKNRELDVAFVCTGAYVQGCDEFGMELLVAPVMYGRTVYYSYVIVPDDSPVRAFEQLKDRTFAFTDPLSNTGKLAPTYRLALMNQTPEKFFRNTVYTYSHDRSIECVARNLVDGAAVDSLVWDFMNRKRPELTSRTRVISRSEPFGIPPFVVSKAVSPELKGQLREVFLHAHDDAEGKKILSGIMIDRFVQVDDAIYDSVRAMRGRTGGHAGK